MINVLLTDIITLYFNLMVMDNINIITMLCLQDEMADNLNQK